MSRPVPGKLALLTAIAAGLVLAAPAAAAQAHTPAPAAHSVSSARPDGVILYFSGDTYPDTPAGQSACNVEGAYDRAHDGVSSWSCELGNPHAGLYNLWLGIEY
jgi:hypothetical protein